MTVTIECPQCGRICTIRETTKVPQCECGCVLTGADYVTNFGAAPDGAEGVDAAIEALFGDGVKEPIPARDEPIEATVSESDSPNSRATHNVTDVRSSSEAEYRMNAEADNRTDANRSHTEDSKPPRQETCSESAQPEKLTDAQRRAAECDSPGDDRAFQKELLEPIVIEQPNEFVPSSSSEGESATSGRRALASRLVGAGVGAGIGAIAAGGIWWVRDEANQSLARAVLFGVLFGGFLGLKGFAHRLWALRNVKLSRSTWRGLVLGAAVGAGMTSTVWLAQATQSPDGARGPLWGFALFGLAFGAMVGFLMASTRQRRCPHCGTNMGRAQNIRLGERKRSSNSRYRLDLRTWVTEGGNERIEGYYLCPRCDREFRVMDLEKQ